MSRDRAGLRPLALAVVLTLAAAGAALAQSRPTLQVAAASDLRFALEEIARRYEASAGVQVKLTFGSSGLLASQVEQGAPFDVFFSANEAFVRSLARAGHIRDETVQLYAIGRIVLWVRADSPLDLGLGPSVLRDARIRFIAIANPSHAPYGQAAVEVLRSSGLYESIRTRLVLGENVSQTLQFVQTGNADIGIVALSLAVAPTMRGAGRYRLIPSYLHKPIRQAVGIATRSPVSGLARGFIAMVSGPAGRAIMRRYGFGLPGERP